MPLDNRIQRKLAGQFTPQIGAGGVGVSTHIGDIGEVSGNVSAGYNPLQSSYGVSPTITVGDSSGANTGAQIGGTAGGIAGTIFGGPIGGAVGSAAGSTIGSGLGDLTSGNASTHRETDRRQDVLGQYAELGMIGKDQVLTNPDGSTFDLRNESKNASGYRNYEINYNRDLDYTAGMAGITLSRMMSGSSNSKAVDQTGNAFGNAFLGKSSSGADFTPDNFNNVMTNARAQYAKSGIKSKEDMLAIANRMYGESRINDFDYATMKQTATMVYDKDFGTAQKLMAGRNAGIDAAKNGSSSAGRVAAGASVPDTRSDAAPSRAAEFPEAKGFTGPYAAGLERLHSPQYSPEEMLLSIQPVLALRKGKYGGDPSKAPGHTAASIVQALGIISAISAVYNQLKGGNKGSTGSNTSGGGGLLGGLGNLGHAIGLDTALKYGEGLFEGASGNVGPVVSGAPVASGTEYSGMLEGSSIASSIGNFFSGASNFIGGLF